MKFLIKRTRPDNFTTEGLNRSQTLGRTIYVVFLVVFAIAVFNYFFGDYVLFRSDGLVMRDQSTVATPFIARVESIYVREGQAVEEGVLLLKLRSPEIIERLGELDGETGRTDSAGSRPQNPVRGPDSSPSGGKKVRR